MAEIANRAAVMRAQVGQNLVAPPFWRYCLIGLRHVSSIRLKHFRKIGFSEDSSSRTFRTYASGGLEGTQMGSEPPKSSVQPVLGSRLLFGRRPQLAKSADGEAAAFPIPCA